jgi:restriction endonuclease S subunit
VSAEWEEVTVKDLCSVKTGKKDVNQGNPLGKYPFYTCAKQHTYSDEWSFDGEALLIAGNGDVGNLSYCDGKFEAYQRTYVLMDFRRVLPHFLYYVFDAGLKPMLFSQKLGNTMTYIKKGMITDFPVPLPSLEEQQRIVAVLDEAFEGLARARAHAEANLQNARELFESIKADELAYTGPDREEVILSEVADIKSGLVDPREDAFADLLHLGAGNMITGTDELVDVKTAREEKLKSGKYLFDETTILYSKIRPYLRKAARPDFQGLCSADVYKAA